MRDVRKPFEKIIVAYDDSPAARDALSVGIELCSVLGTPLETITVIEPPPMYAAIIFAVNPDVAEGIAVELKRHWQEIVDSAVAEGRRRSVEVIGHLVEADEVDGVISFIRERRADLLIIGLRQHSAHIARLWSTVSSLEENAPCSVLAVHSPLPPAPKDAADQTLRYASV
jgi:nucleotide-binding universal stress UspA family protein